MTKKRLQTLLSKFHRTTIPVVGDVMIDEHVWGHVPRISPEAPVPVVEVQFRTYNPGGAANVARNIISLGGECPLFGVIGHDDMGRILRDEVENCQIDPEGLIRVKNRKTTAKSRIMAHHQHLVQLDGDSPDQHQSPGSPTLGEYQHIARVDEETRDPIATNVVARILRGVRPHLRDSKILIIQDYGKGTITRRLVEGLVAAAEEGGAKVLVDPWISGFEIYRGVHYFKPNHREAGLAVGYPIHDEAALERAGWTILEKLDSEAVFLTLGPRGMKVFPRDGSSILVPPVAPRQVFEMAGAGDTAAAGLALALSCGATLEEAALVANQAASVVIGKPGIATVLPEEILGGAPPSKLKRRRTRRAPDPSAGSR